MAGSAVVGVVGTAPISFTDSAGAQKSVPLSALQFSGSALQLTPDWVTELNPPDAKTLLAVATARLAAGELIPPPVRPPSPAIAVTAAHPGPESNNITVDATVTRHPDPDPGQLLNSTTIKFGATETDTYTGLTTAAIGETIGVDIPSGSLPAGTGLVVVKSGSISTSDALPVDQQHDFTSAGFDVKAADSSILFTLVPRVDPTGKGGLSVHVAPAPSGTTFTVTVTYDSPLRGGRDGVGHDRSHGGSSMGISADCAGTITIAEVDQDRRGWRMALQYASTDRDSSINQSYCHINYQLADCRANAPPVPPGAALTGNTNVGRPLPFSLGLGASRCRTCSRRAAGSARYVADLACSHGGREDHGI